MFYLLASSVLTLVLGWAAFGQPVCPSITLEAPARALGLEVEETFRVRVSGDKYENLRFHWASTIGKVLYPYSGREMKLVVDRENNGYNATVFVRIDGLPADCPNSASEVVGVVALPIAEPSDRFGPLNRYDLIARIDNYKIVLENSDLKAKGLIDLYFGLDESRAQRVARIRNIVEVIRARKLDIRRVEFAFIETKSGPGNTYFWIVPDGANRKWIVEDRPGVVFVEGEKVMQNPQAALPKRICDCKWN